MREVKSEKKTDRLFFRTPSYRKRWKGPETLFNDIYEGDLNIGKKTFLGSSLFFLAFKRAQREGGGR